MDQKAKAAFGFLTTKIEAPDKKLKLRRIEKR